MNRRQMMLIPGAALIAEQAFAHEQSLSKAVTGLSAHKSQKLLLKLSRTRAAAKVPKSDAKAAKYLKSMSAFLGLSSDQQQQASTIFAAARGTLTSLKASVKPARKSLQTAVKMNDAAGIKQAAGVLGDLKAQRTAASAGANAAFFQMLSACQQAKLTQLHT